MDDIVAVRVITGEGRAAAFLTWGRIQDPVDPRPVEAIVMANASRFDLGGTALRAELCSSIREVADAPNFYEAFFEMTQRAQSRRNAPEVWSREMDEAMREGRELYFLGKPG